MTDLNSYTRRFWEELELGEFLIHMCNDCEENYFPPSPICPNCHSDFVEWKNAVGTGTLYSFTKQHVAAEGLETPIVFGLVQLSEGPKILVEIDADYSELSIKQSVELNIDDYDKSFDRGDLSEYPFFTAVPRK